jgi:hypothetical protein
MAQNGSKWLTFERVLITDLQVQKRFLIDDRNGLVHSPSRRRGQWARASLSGASPTTDRRVGWHKVALSFRCSEIGAATWWFVENPERTTYPLYLHCTAYCGFCQGTYAVIGMEPVKLRRSCVYQLLPRLFFENSPFLVCRQSANLVGHEQPTGTSLSPLATPPWSRLPWWPLCVRKLLNSAPRSSVSDERISNGSYRVSGGCNQEP